MKKALMLAAAIALLAAPVFAEDEAPTLGGLHGASGSVEFSFGDDKINDGEAFGFGSDKDGSTKSSITASIATEKVEAGATISLVPTVELNKNDNTVETKDINTDAYDAAIKWYKTEKGDDYGYFTQKFVWEDEIWAALQALTLPNGGFTLAEAKAMYTDADGWDIDGDDIKDSSDFESVKNALDAAILGNIKAEITALDNEAGIVYTYALANDDATKYTVKVIAGENVLHTDGDPTTTDPYTLVTDAEAKVIAAINEATSDFNDAYGGVDGDDTYDVTYPVSDAYFRLLGVAGVVDVEFELNGKNVAVGSKFTQEEDNDPLHLGMGLALTEGVVEGLSASILYTHDAAVAAKTDDILTIGSEKEDAEDAANAILVKGGFAHELFNASADFAITNFKEIDPWFSVRGGVTLADIAGLNADLEFTKLDKDNGMGLAIGAGASILGITPSVDFRYHIEGTDKFDTTEYGEESDSKTTDETALAYFNSELTSNGYLGFGLAVDFAEIMGMSLITLDGGFNMVFTKYVKDADKKVYYNNDWNVGLDLDFTELFAPVTLGGGFSSTFDMVRAWDLAVGAEFFGVTAAVALGDDLGDADTKLTFDASLAYTYDIVDLKAAFGINKDGDKSLAFTAKTSF